MCAWPTITALGEGLADSREEAGAVAGIVSVGQATCKDKMHLLQTSFLRLCVGFEEQKKSPSGAVCTTG